MKLRKNRKVDKCLSPTIVGTEYGLYDIIFLLKRSEHSLDRNRTGT